MAPLRSQIDWRVCDHADTPLPSRPIPDWTGRCPTCGEKVKHGRGRLITVRENNRYAAGVRPGDVWELPDGTMVRISEVVQMAYFTPIGDTSAPMMGLAASSVLEGRPVMERDDG